MRQIDTLVDVTDSVKILHKLGKNCETFVWKPDDRNNYHCWTSDRYKFVTSAGCVYKSSNLHPIFNKNRTKKMSADLDSANDSIANQLILQISQRGYVSYVIKRRVFCDIFNLRVRVSASVCSTLLLNPVSTARCQRNCKSCNKALWL